MTYVYSVLANIGDPAGFAQAGEDWAADRLRNLGALHTTASQIIMGGELAGSSVVGFEYESVDAAMAGQAGLYADADIVAMMRDTQVSVIRRNLFKLQAEVGTRTGEFGTILYGAGAPVDDATAQSNLELNWSHMNPGANGIMSLSSIASGPSPFTGTAVTYTDSLDSLLAASEAMFADQDVREMMAKSGTTILGRVITRRLF